MKKLLIIEDNDDIRENTAEILEISNYQVFTAANGKIGVEIALEKKPDLIICDIMMPVLDGFGVLHAVHKNDSIKNTPFIFLTAKTDRADLRKGMDLGADDYITKPFEGAELLQAIESRLRKMDLLKEEFTAGITGLHKLRGTAKRLDLLKELTVDRPLNKYKKKQVIFSEGNRPSRLFYILKGKVKTFKTNDDGKELVVGLHKEGDFLGYVPLLENTNYKETGCALDDCELAIIPREEFEELINNNSEVSKKFIQILSQNIGEKEEQLVSMAYNSLRKKVAEALMILYKKYNTGNTEKFIINIGRENLATIAGTATESLIRTLSDFKSEKLIEIKEGCIIILNEQKLKNLLN